MSGQPYIPMIKLDYNVRVHDGFWERHLGRGSLHRHGLRKEQRLDQELHHSSLGIKFMSEASHQVLPAPPHRTVWEARLWLDMSFPPRLRRNHPRRNDYSFDY